MKKVIFLILTILSILGIQVYAQTTLSPGDIFVVTINSNPDFIEFASRIDIETGTTVYLSDDGWTSTGSRRGNEGYLTVNATSLIPAGTILSISGADSASIQIEPNYLATVSRSLSFNLSTAGDQILVYTGASGIDPNPNFIYGISFAITIGWVNSGNISASTSYLPLSLSIGSSAFSYTPSSHKSIQYNCPARNMAYPAFRSGLYDNLCWSGNASSSYYAELSGGFIYDLPPVTTIIGSSSLTVDWGDNYIESGATCSDDIPSSSWNLLGPTSGSFDQYGMPGVYPLEYTCIDSIGQETTAIRYVTLSAPLIPDPQDDYYTIDQDTQLELHTPPNVVITNDSGMQYVVSGGMQSPPSYGTILLTGMGFIYIPNSGFVGQDTLVYYLCNILSQCGTGLVTINIVDTTPPVVTLVGSGTITIEVGSGWTDPGATWIDNVDGSGDMTSTGASISGTVNTGVVGIYTLYYTYTDTSGNTGNTVTRTVNVVDTTPPVVTLVGSGTITINQGSGFTDPGFTCIDAVDGSLTGTVSGSVNNSIPGSYTLQYMCVDTAGNTGTTTRTVIVLDTTPPVVTLVGSGTITINQGSGFTDPGFTCIDAVDGSLTGTVSGSVNNSIPGTYTLQYMCVDTAGNTGTTTRTVIVLDTTPPVVTLVGSGIVTIEVGSGWTDPGATWTDNVDGSGDMTATGASVSGTVNTGVVGIYALYYTYVDTSGNTGNTVTRTVNIVDTTPPVINMNGSPTITINQGPPFVDPGATCMDIYDGTIAVTVSGSVNNSIPGTYTLQYICTDTAGNTTTSTRTVVVNPVFAGGGGGSTYYHDPNDNDLPPSTVDKNIFNSTIDPDTCFAPIDILTMDQGGMTPYQEIAHQMLYSYGLTTIPGTVDFGSDRQITRAEAAKFLVQFAQNVLCRNKINTYDGRFVDINDSHPDLQTNIKLAYEYGIFYGSEGGLFRPDDFITRDELIATMVRLVTNKYDDLDGSGWADNYKKTLDVLSNKTLDNTTRGNIAEVLYDLYKNNNYNLEDIGYVLD